MATTPKRDVNVFNYEPPNFSKPRTRPLEVICVGLSRTGTSSMLEAMNILGYGDVWNSRDMIRRHQTPFAASLLHKRLTGLGQPYGREQFESLFGELVASMAEDIIAAYPEAKIILTIREDEDRWLRSLLNTLWYNYSTWSHWFLRKTDSLFWEQDQFLKLFWGKLFGGDPAVHGLRVYREHSALVQRIVQPEERLLVFDTKRGWAPLCRFLGKEVPREEFPWVNKTEDHRALFGSGRSKALRKWMANAFVTGVVPVAAIALLLVKRKQVGEVVRQALKR